MKEENNIYVKEQDVPITKTRKGFLKKFLATIPATYDVDTKKEECDAGRKRSVSDLLKLTRRRFKKTSLNAIMRILGELNDEKLCVLTYCGTIQKVVVMTPSHHINFEKETSFITSHGRKYGMDTEGVDGYTLKMLEEIKIKEHGE